ncbi:pyridoxamine 5'-phosphate oxidase family protein [Mobilicoccus pelagius]|uniref:General stress protein FMN-binding split barrel domain-containing protein n=1 Tax=Mobilicoccus pelagius NBRC 104925 TaxID=1089455 RepID=H5USR9_9MICO|nr:pyridoxamine 5'-phosphate oxidase family protein [Mobilicoccus pelagius]GAB48777.1 hypothetical protein MOPEL_080_00560 [Mobilicoccus pelagius NBRC 104925]
MTTQQSSNDEGREKVAGIIEKTRVAMLTFHDGRGRLVSCPMGTQDVDFDGTVLFLTERDSDKVDAITANPQVNVAYSGDSEWVSLSGHARIENDVEKIRELWGPLTDGFMEGGPENPDNVLIVVEGDTAEYWNSPGGKIGQIFDLVRTATTKKEPRGENDVVDL